MLIRSIYSLLLTLASPFFLYSLYKKKPGKASVGHRWKEHFGCTPKLTEGNAPIWIHAVSVGEVIAVSPLIKALKAHHTELRILLTTTTSTGAEQAEKLGSLIEHRYMPLDFGFAVKSFLNKMQPTQLLIMETELWPNTLHVVAQAGLPITIINARLSARSAKRYGKLPSIFNMLAKNISKVLCQHSDDAQRFIELGFPQEKVNVTGSIKFDINISPKIKELASTLRRELGVNRPIWIAASTHPGEDEKVFAAHNLILKSYPDALLVLVPRHPERFNDMFTLAEQLGFNTVRRTASHHIATATQVYLADTMGEMLVLLGAADVCFMGGSLIGNKVGGHNLLEPAALGLATLTGPSYFNFTDITNQLNKEQATNIIRNTEELAEQVTALFSDKKRLNKQGQAALAVVQKNQGAIQKTLSQLKLNL